GSGLVILRTGQAAPTLIAAVPGAIITVNSSDDSNNRNNVLTLREAILLANGGTSASGGLSKAELTPAESAQVQGTPSANQFDEIRFNIPGGVNASSPSEPGFAARTVLPANAEPTYFSSPKETKSANYYLARRPLRSGGSLSPLSRSQTQLVQPQDAHRDVVAASPAPFSCAVPGFGAPHQLNLGAGPVDPLAVAISDFNSDGKADVVTANSRSD